MNGRVVSAQRFLSLQTRAMSSGEVTQKNFKYPGYKRGTVNQEGHPDSEQCEEDRCNLLWLRTNKGA